MLDQGILSDSNCASRGIGYRQALAALQHWHNHPHDAQPPQLVCPALQLLLRPWLIKTTHNRYAYQQRQAHAGKVFSRQRGLFWAWR